MGEIKYICEFCCSTNNLTKHHLTPRSYARRMLIKDRPTIITMTLCRKCHNKVHAYATVLELVKLYNTPEKIIELLKSKKEHLQNILSMENTYDNKLVKLRTIIKSKL